MTELERVELNAIIHNQREKLRELNETRDILRKDKRILEKRLEEAEYCLDLIEIHTGAIGQSKQDMNESLIAIMNICSKYFEGGLDNKTDLPKRELSLVKMVEVKGKVK